MKRIILHLLLATALIFQGIAGAFAEPAPQAMHGSCCPDGAQAGQVHHAKCPCPEKQHCMSDCQLMCASGNLGLITPYQVAAGSVPSPSARPARADSLVAPRSDTPPIRPPIA
jgi:hypothetical protein